MDPNDDFDGVFPWDHNPARPYVYGPFDPKDPRYDPNFFARTSSKRASLPSWKIDDLLEGHGSTINTVQALTNSLLWKYTSILTAQPFEAAMVVLQVRSADKPPEEHKRKISDSYDDDDDMDDVNLDDEPVYFTFDGHSTAAGPAQSRDPYRRRGHAAAAAAPTSPRHEGAAAPAHHLDIKNPDSILEVVGQHWAKEGAKGVWKGTNVTFLYNILHSLIENWSRGALAGLLEVPDLVAEENMLDAFTSTAHPMLALGVCAGAAVATGLLLAPLDLVRTKLLITTTKSEPGKRRDRGILSNLRSLPSYFCPPVLALPTMLNSLVNPLLTISLPLTLQSRFKMDWQLSTVNSSISRFCAASAALFLKVPLETALRRGQVSVLSSKRYLEASGEKALETTVRPGAYRGVAGTIYWMIAQEGTRRRADGKQKRRGQGPWGVMRGWKVGFSGLVGLWAAGILSSDQQDAF